MTRECWLVVAFGYLAFGAMFWVKMWDSGRELKEAFWTLVGVLVGAVIWLPAVIWTGLIASNPNYRTLGFWAQHFSHARRYRGLYWASGPYLSDRIWLIAPNGKRVLLNHEGRERLRNSSVRGATEDAAPQAFLKTLWEDASP